MGLRRMRIRQGFGPKTLPHLVPSRVHKHNQTFDIIRYFQEQLPINPDSPSSLAMLARISPPFQRLKPSRPNSRYTDGERFTASPSPCIVSLMPTPPKSRETLTFQVYKDHLAPRGFSVPLRWISRASFLAWILIVVTGVSLSLAIKQRYQQSRSSPERLRALESEIASLKDALESQALKAGSDSPLTVATPSVPNTPTQDPAASDQEPEPQPGAGLKEKSGVWAGLATKVTVPDASYKPTVRIEKAKIALQGRTAVFTANLLFNDPGNGNQQGHFVVLGRSADRVVAYPSGALNIASGSSLFDVERGEYFSVGRFRLIKATFPNVDRISDLKEIQLYIFDLNQKLILHQNFNDANT